MKKTQLTKLKFNVMRWDSNANALVQMNLFSSLKVLDAVAKFVKMDCILPKWLSNDDPLSFCFSSCRGRVQWEMGVSGPFDDKTQKYDVYQMYIEPNRNILMEMVHSVSKNSAQQYLRERKKKYGF